MRCCKIPSQDPAILHMTYFKGSREMVLKVAAQKKFRGFKPGSFIDFLSTGETRNMWVVDEIEEVSDSVLYLFCIRPFQLTVKKKKIKKEKIEGKKKMADKSE